MNYKGVFFGSILLLLSSVFLEAKNVTKHRLSEKAYSELFLSQTQKGNKLTHIEGYEAGGKLYYAAIFLKSDGVAWKSHHKMSETVYRNKYKSYKEEGYSLTHVSAFTVGGKDYYAGIWEKRDRGKYLSHHRMTAEKYQELYATYKSKNYRLTLVDGYVVNGKTRYIAIWAKKNGPSLRTHHGMTSDSYQKKAEAYVKDGYYIVYVSGYTVGGKDYYAAIWHKKTTKGMAARHRLNGKNYQSTFDNMYYQSFSLKHISAYTYKGKAAYAAIWESNNKWKLADLNHINSTVNKFLKEYDIPGASLAIAKDGKLVFAQGYGYANKAKGEIVGPKHMFHIASVSKPITSAAIMHLIEKGKLKLEDKVFGAGAILGKKYGEKEYGNREKAITVKHLLEHTAGGKAWDNKNDDGVGDPMGMKLNYSHDQLIGWVLDSRNPSSTPGTTYAYSNFGYCILGRIIEKKSGMKYDAYVKKYILNKSGVKRTHISKEKKYKDEVIYYKDGKAMEHPNVSRMDSHGGWVSTPINLLRFALHVDGFASEPDILKKSTVNTMQKESSANKYYAKGWNISGQADDYYHTGALRATGALLIYTHDGYAWAFLINKRHEAAMTKMLRKVINGVEHWPNVDKF